MVGRLNGTSKRVSGSGKTETSSFFRHLSCFMSDLIFQLQSNYLLPEDDPNLEIDWLAHVRELPKKYRPYNLLLLPPPPPGVIRLKPIGKAGKYYYNSITKHIARRMTTPPSPIIAPDPNRVFTTASHLYFYVRSSAFHVTADEFQPPRMTIHENQAVWKLVDEIMVPAQPSPVGFGDCSSFMYIGHIMPARTPATLPGLVEETEFGPEDRAIYVFRDLDYAGAPDGKIRLKLGYSDDMYHRQQTLQSGAIGQLEFLFKLNPGKYTSRSVESLLKKMLVHNKVPGTKAGERYDLNIFEFSDLLRAAGSIQHMIKLASVYSTPDGRMVYNELDGRLVTGKIIREASSRRINIDANTTTGVIHQERVTV